MKLKEIFEVIRIETKCHIKTLDESHAEVCVDLSEKIFDCIMNKAISELDVEANK